MELNKKFSKVLLDVKTDHSYIDFEGIWTIIVDNDANEIVYSSIQLTSETVSARNRKDHQKEWGFRNDEEAKKIFSEIFELNDDEDDKITTSNKVKELNDFIFNRNLKPSTLITFLGRTNSSGALSKSKSGAILIKKENFSKDEFGLKEEDDIKGWYFVSLINQIQSKSNIGFSHDEINQIGEIQFKELFNFGFKNYPWGSKEDKNLEVSFKDAFISQNAINFVNKTEINELLLVPNEYIPETLLSYIQDSKFDRENIKNKLRRLWSRNVNLNKERIFKKSVEKDFVNGMKKFERAHILEEAKVLDKIIENINNKNKAIKLLKNLLDEENYILLDQTTHSYWDSDEIYITSKGEIVERKCEEHDFEVLTKYSNKFSEERFLTKKRIELLEIREQWNNQ